MVRGDIREVPLTVTFAFGTAEPEASVTTPVIFPVMATCAEIIAGKKKTKANIIKMRFFIASPQLMDRADCLGQVNRESTRFPSRMAPAPDHKTLSMLVEMDYVQNPR